MGQKTKLVLPFILMMMCPVFYNIIGSNVSSNGVPQGPFFLVSLGYLFFGVGVLQMANYLLQKRK